MPTGPSGRGVLIVNVDSSTAMQNFTGGRPAAPCTSAMRGYGGVTGGFASGFASGVASGGGGLPSGVLPSPPSPLSSSLQPAVINATAPTEKIAEARLNRIHVLVRI